MLRILGRIRLVAHLFILYTQLTNGARVGEALEALKKFVELKGKERWIEVRIEKQKKGGDKTRDFHIPEEIRFKDIPININSVKKTATIQWCRDNLHFNSHKLRYSWTTYELVVKGRNPVTVGKMGGRINLNLLIDYHNELQAKQFLKEDQ